MRVTAVLIATILLAGCAQEPTLEELMEDMPGNFGKTEDAEQNTGTSTSPTSRPPAASSASGKCDAPATKRYSQDVEGVPIGFDYSQNGNNISFRVCFDADFRLEKFEQVGTVHLEHEGDDREMWLTFKNERLSKECSRYSSVPCPSHTLNSAETTDLYFTLETEADVTGFEWITRVPFNQPHNWCWVGWVYSDHLSPLDMDGPCPAEAT